MKALGQVMSRSAFIEWKAAYAIEAEEIKRSSRSAARQARSGGGIVTDG